MAFIVLFLLGVLYRLWISHIVPQPFVYDQIEYHYFAQQIVEKGLFAWTARLYGYPLFLSFIYKIFGVGNINAVTTVQAVLDATTGLLVYLISEKIFKNRPVSTVFYALYLFNPFTSTYVTLVLTEILTVFLLSFISYLILILIEKKNRWVVLTLGILLGFLPQVRPSFLVYSTVVIIYLLFWLYKIKFKEKLLTPILIVLLYLLPFSYNIAGNWVYFKALNPTTVDNLLTREFYLSLYLSGKSAEQNRDAALLPKEAQNLYKEYSTPQNAQERKLMAEKYARLSIQKIKSDPVEFILSRLQKAWSVWEKHSVFAYDRPKDRFTDDLIYWSNNIFLFLAVLGSVWWTKRKHQGEYYIWNRFTVFTLFYISFIHAFTVADERYSLPGYPFIFLFAGYGIWHIIRVMRK